MKFFSSDEFIRNGNTIGVKCERNKHACGLHKHSFIEFVYILSGECRQTVDGIEYATRRGDILYIGYGATHSFESEGGFSHVELFFSPELLEDEVVTPTTAISLLALSTFNELRGDKNGGYISIPKDSQKEFEFILEAMEKEYGKGEKSSRTVLESYLNILMVRMLNAAEKEGTDIAGDILEGLKDYIDAHPEEQMSLSSLAAKSFYNPSYLSRVFKKKFNASPTEYIRKMRIAKATELLAKTDKPIDEIISLSGFTDRGSFYHLFAKETGMTPSEYRSKRMG